MFSKLFIDFRQFLPESYVPKMKKTPYLKKDMTIFMLFYKKIFNNDFH